AGPGLFNASLAGNRAAVRRWRSGVRAATSQSCRSRRAEVVFPSKGEYSGHVLGPAAGQDPGHARVAGRPSRTGKGKAVMRLASSILAALLAFATPASAAEEAISVQLNAAETVGGACRVTMVVRNDLTTALSEFGLDLVVFDGSGGVADYAA